MQSTRAYTYPMVVQRDALVRVGWLVLWVCLLKSYTRTARVLTGVQSDNTGDREQIGK